MENSVDLKRPNPSIIFLSTEVQGLPANLGSFDVMRG